MDPRTAPTRWTDTSESLEQRVWALIDAMTIEERLAQLGSVWLTSQPGPAGDLLMSPYDHAHSGAEENYIGALPESLADVIKHGTGQVTRVFGTVPIEPVAGARALAALQRELLAGRLGIPAMAHEECLAGLTAYTAAAFPTPLAWAATFNPAAVHAMAGMIGADMHRLGVHQGLSPVLDVVRDYRWGRVEETLGEDPYLVGVLGAAYVAGLEEAGIVATVKHFAGYSASVAARNLAPVSVGPRDLRDVILKPFEIALKHGGARGVMLAYTSLDGVPPASDAHLVTTILREEWGFEGVVVSDYYGISFLETQQHVAQSPADAAAQALRAGVDVELPALRCYGSPLAELVRSGEVAQHLVDRSLARVLRLKVQLGLLDAGWDPAPSMSEIDLDSPAHRDLARELAEQSIILVKNSGVLPLPADARITVVGPVADDPYAFLGCYSFPNHVGSRHPEVGLGIRIPTFLSALRAEFPAAEITYAQGCDINSGSRDNFAGAVAAAQGADICLALLGDRSGLFGEGTSGEGSDVADMSLPGVQADLLSELLATGTPTVLVAVTGRPYAIGDQQSELAAWVQAFFPGEEGGAALAGVLSGRVNPSGRLPVQIPRHPLSPPTTYLHSALAGPSNLTVIDPTPAFPFGHGLSYTTFAYEDLELSEASLPTDGAITVGCTVRNCGERPGAEVVQLYLTDPVASVTRPVRELIGFARVELDAGRAARVTFILDADRAAFTGRDLRRIVEPGPVHLQIGRNAADVVLQATAQLVGPEREVGANPVLLTPVQVRPWQGRNHG